VVARVEDAAAVIVDSGVVKGRDAEKYNHRTSLRYRVALGDDPGLDDPPI
jgi:hypothetical protein